jgi:hypothetical protein
VGQIAEILPCQGQQLVITEAAIIKGFDPNNPIHQLAMVAFQIVEQQLTHVVGTTTVAQQQHDIGISDGGGKAGQVIVIDGCSLPGLIAIMAMAEVLIGAPEAMGLEYGVLHLFPLQAEHIGVAMAEMQDQATTLIAPGRRPIGLGMVKGDAGRLQQMANPHDRFRIEIGLTQATAGVDPGFLASGHLQAQAPVTQFGDRRPEGTKEGFHLRYPHSMLEGMGIESLQRAQMVAFHG